MIMLQPDRLGVHQKASDGCPTCPFFALSVRMLLLAIAGDKDYNDFEEIGIKVKRKSR
jgi:hypothetical protein